MKKIRDHYFAAWLKVQKHIDYKKGDNYLEFEIDSKEYNEFYSEYKKIQPLLKEIRNTIKILNGSETNK